MTRAPNSQDALDEVLAELDQARHNQSGVGPHPVPTRRGLQPPEVLQRARWVPNRGAVVVVALCAILAAAIFTARWLVSDTGDSQPTAASSRASVAGSALSSGVAGDRARTSPPASATAASSSSTWSVHVVGAVRRPGVVVVTVGARVADAITAAGGLVPGADTGAINLARKLSDGEQIHVPRPGEKRTPPADAGGVSGGATSASVSGGTTSGPGGEKGPVRLNEATLEQLDALPGVGPVMAQRILDWRQQHGQFTSIDELGEVSGIGDKTLERLRPQVAV